MSAFSYLTLDTDNVVVGTGTYSSDDEVQVEQAREEVVARGMVLVEDLSTIQPGRQRMTDAGLVDLTEDEIAAREPQMRSEP